MFQCDSDPKTHRQCSKSKSEQKNTQWDIISQELASQSCFIKHIWQFIWIQIKTSLNFTLTLRLNLQLEGPLVAVG